MALAATVCDGRYQLMDQAGGGRTTVTVRRQQ
jgi:hypothetical protein